MNKKGHLRSGDGFKTPCYTLKAELLLAGMFFP